MWHTEIKKDKNKIIDFVAYFEKELAHAKKEIKIAGNLEKCAAELPGIVDLRFGQLQEVETVLEMLNTELKKVRAEKFKMFLERYQKALSSSDAWRYTDGDPDVFAQCEIINEVAHIRNQYLGITKSLEQKSFMLGHIVRLRTAGLEDARLNE